MFNNSNNIIKLNRNKIKLRRIGVSCEREDFVDINNLISMTQIGVYHSIAILRVFIVVVIVDSTATAKRVTLVRI